MLTKWQFTITVTLCLRSQNARLLVHKQNDRMWISRELSCESEIYVMFSPEFYVKLTQISSEILVTE